MRKYLMILALLSLLTTKIVADPANPTSALIARQLQGVGGTSSVWFRLDRTSPVLSGQPGNNDTIYAFNLRGNKTQTGSLLIISFKNPPNTTQLDQVRSAFNQIAQDHGITPIPSSYQPLQPQFAPQDLEFGSTILQPSESVAPEKQEGAELRRQGPPTINLE